MTRTIRTVAELGGTTGALPEIIEGLGQFRAGFGAIVTDWCNTREEALAEYVKLIAAASCVE